METGLFSCAWIEQNGLATWNLSASSPCFSVSTHDSTVKRGCSLLKRNPRSRSSTPVVNRDADILCTLGIGELNRSYYWLIKARSIEAFPNVGRSPLWSAVPLSLIIMIDHNRSPVRTAKAHYRTSAPCCAGYQGR